MTIILNLIKLDESKSRLIKKLKKNKNLIIF